MSQTQDETIVEFSKDPGLFQPVLSAPNPCGAGYFITRFPRKFRVLTPFINASVEGTEFLVAMRCESVQVAVFEGRVLAQELLSASSRAFSLKEGEALEAGSAQPAAVTLIIEPVDAVQWALYYPPITESPGEAAADQKCDRSDAAAQSVCIVQRAEQRLRSGRVEEAEADIQLLLNVGLGDGDAYALLSIISLVKNDKAKALELAGHATQLSPSSSRTWLALSYAQQASFELEKALAAAKKAAALAPGSSLAQARVAELLMSLGRIGEAETTAATAVKNNPNDSRAHMVLGFVHLAQIDTKKARQDFLAAIELDSTDPLPGSGWAWRPSGTVTCKPAASRSRSRWCSIRPTHCSAAISARPTTRNTPSSARLWPLRSSASQSGSIRAIPRPGSMTLFSSKRPNRRVRRCRTCRSRWN